MSKFRLRVPHVYTIAFALLILAALAAIVVPAGSFARDASRFF